MALTISKHVNDMSAGTVPAGTTQYLMVKDPAAAIIDSAAWLLFSADNAAWRQSNPNMSDPKQVPFAAAVDVDNPTMAEQLFVQTRFMVTHSDDPSRLVREPALWAQLNVTNFPGLDIAAYMQAASAIYNAQRITAGLVPA